MAAPLCTKQRECSPDNVKWAEEVTGKDLFGFLVCCLLDGSQKAVPGIVDKHIQATMESVGLSYSSTNLLDIGQFHRHHVQPLGDDIGS